MKRLLIIVLLGLLVPFSVLSQSTISFGIGFGGNPPPHSEGVPQSGALLTGETFYAAVYLDNNNPAGARIAEMQSGGWFTTVHEFTNLVFAAYPPPPGATAFSFEQSWSIDGVQMESLLAGKWYVEVAYENTSYLGHIVPVPEPSSVAFWATGGVMTLAAWRRRRN